MIPWPPPVSDVRWGPALFPPFQLPSRCDSTLPGGYASAPEGGQQSLSMLDETVADSAEAMYAKWLDQTAAPSSRQLQLVREAAIAAAKIEVGLSQGAQQFSEWMVEATAGDVAAQQAAALWAQEASSTAPSVHSLVTRDIDEGF